MPLINDTLGEIMRESEPILCMDLKTMEALKKHPRLGVAVAYQNNETKKWGCVGKNATPPGPLEISNFMLDGQYSEDATTFAIINPEGELCYTNSEDQICVNRDQNGFIHINNNEYLIKPIEGVGTSTYIGGETSDVIAHKLEMAVEMGFVKAPDGFGPNGFENPPIFTPTDSCQE